MEDLGSRPISLNILNNCAFLQTIRNEIKAFLSRFFFFKKTHKNKNNKSTQLVGLLNKSCGEVWVGIEEEWQMGIKKKKKTSLVIGLGFSTYWLMVSREEEGQSLVCLL